LWTAADGYGAGVRPVQPKPLVFSPFLGTFPILFPITAPASNELLRTVTSNLNDIVDLERRTEFPQCLNPFRLGNQMDLFPLFCKSVENRQEHHHITDPMATVVVVEIEGSAVER